MSKTASKVTRCGWRLTSVAAYAARTVSRSCQRTRSSAADRVEALGERHRQPRGAQRLDEADVGVEEALTGPPA